MRRLLLVPFLLAAAAAAPVSAQNQVCAGAGSHGPVLPNTGTAFSCRTVPSPLGTYCRMNTVDVDGDVWTSVHVCVPVDPPAGR